MARFVFDDPDLTDPAPIDLSLLNRAARLMQQVRAAQEASGKSTAGRRASLSDDIRAAVAATGNDSRILAGLRAGYAVSMELQNEAMTRFEEIARRNDIAFPNKLRPAIYKLLGIELALNIGGFQATAGEQKRLLPITLVRGDVTGELNARRYPAFTGLPFLFKHAALHYPSPGKAETFIEDVIEAVETLPGKHIQDDRSQPTYGEYFGEVAGILNYAAMHYTGSGNAEAYLDGVVDKVSQLEQRYDVSPTGKLRRVDLVTAITQHPKKIDIYLGKLITARRTGGGQGAGPARGR